MKSAEEELALGGGWGDSEDFAPYKARRLAPDDQHQVTKWVDTWPVAGLTEEEIRRIKAKLLRADSAYWSNPEKDPADLLAMRYAFDGVANVLFDANILTEKNLAEEIPTLVWDTAVAGGWYRFGSEAPKKILPESLGHYFVWRDETKDWNALFRAETGKWRAELLELTDKPERQFPPPQRVRQRDHGLQNLKGRVRKLHGEGLTHREICDRLANSPRPPRAGWRDLEWPLAYKRHSAAVTKWLSDACR